MRLNIEPCQNAVDFARAAKLFTAQYPEANWNAFSNLAQFAAQQLHGSQTYIAKNRRGKFVGAALAVFNNAAAEISHFASVYEGDDALCVELTLIRTICALHTGRVRINLARRNKKNRQEIVCGLGRGEIHSEWLFLNL